MNKKRATKKRWTVHRKFEPNRLSADIMVQAYAQIIPPQVRVVHLGMRQTEASGGSQKPGQDSREERPQYSNSNRHPEYSLVIDPITKKEAA